MGIKSSKLAQYLSNLAILVSQIPDLDASKIVSGVFPAERLDLSSKSPSVHSHTCADLYALCDILAQASTSITTVPATLLTLALPVAGEWLFESKIAMSVASVSTSRTISLAMNVTNMVSMMLTAEVAQSNPAAASRASITSSGSVVSVGMSANQSGWIDTFGKIVVNAPSVITVSASISAETGSARGGSFIKASRKP